MSIRVYNYLDKIRIFEATSCLIKERLAHLDRMPGPLVDLTEEYGDARIVLDRARRLKSLISSA
jgi:hypothetical protein